MGGRGQWSQMTGALLKIQALENPASYLESNLLLPVYQNYPQIPTLTVLLKHFVSDERQLQSTDIPLLERLMLGPTDSVKIYIRDRPDIPSFVPQIHIPSGASVQTPSPVEETPLPEEVQYCKIPKYTDT